MATQFTPTTTQVVVVCPRCAHAVILPLTQVEVSLGDTIVGPNGTVAVLSLDADLVARGPHSCSLGGT